MKEVFNNTQNEGLYSGRTVSDNWLKKINEILEIKDISRDNALDIGSGGGIYTFGLKRLGFSNVTGVDSSATMLKSAIKENNDESIKFKIGNIFNNGLHDNNYNFVMSRAVIHHIENLTKAFSETYRVIHKDGLLLIQDRTKEDLDIPASSSNLRGYLYEFSPSLKNFDKKRRYQEEVVKKNLLDAGFKKVTTLKINELRSVYKDIQELKDSYLSREGKSILFKLSDKELDNFVEYLIHQLPCETDIKEVDQWTLWIAKK